MEQIRANDELRVATEDRVIYDMLARRGYGDRITLIETAASFCEAEEPPADALMTTAESGFAWALAHPRFEVVFTKGLPRAIPLVFALPFGEPGFERYINQWIEMRELDGTIADLYDKWVLGKVEVEHEPRWSVIRNVLGWVD